MKSKIEQAFNLAKSRNRAALIPYLTGGYPTLETCAEMVLALDRSGADLIEIGLPFSDPLADGPVIQEASRLALEAGLTTAGLLDMIESISPKISAPLIIMTYYNPVLAQGLENFVGRAARAGVSGLIIPDLPPEEADPWLDAAEPAGLETIFLVAPTTTPQRLETISLIGRGFVYLVSMTGVTGSDLALSDRLTNDVNRVKAVCRRPVAVGFGIDSPAKAAAVGRLADGVIVGSALVKAVMSQPGREAEAAGRFTADLARALDNSTDQADDAGSDQGRAA